jgi:hypothetical protein
MALPEPECGLVLSYSYLWRHESESGRTEGVKERPCAIILVADSADGVRLVTVAPITHLPSRDLGVAVEIPPPVKRHLGLDGERSWMILDEANEFAWPGFDLCPIQGKAGRYDYGLLPPAFFTRIVNRILELRREGRTFSSRRDAG